MGWPALADEAQWRGVEVVELVATLAARPDQAGCLQDVEVLRYGLARRADAVTHDQSRTDLEEGLAVAIGQLVENRPSRGVGEGPKDLVAVGCVGHSLRICKWLLACQPRRTAAGASLYQ